MIQARVLRGPMGAPPSQPVWVESRWFRPQQASAQSGTECFRKPQEPQEASGNFRRLHAAPKSTRNPRTPQSHQEIVAGGPGSSQEYPRPQEAPRGLRRLHEAPESSRRQQEAPGGGGRRKGGKQEDEKAGGRRRRRMMRRRMRRRRAGGPRKLHEAPGDSRIGSSSASVLSFQSPFSLRSMGVPIGPHMASRALLSALTAQGRSPPRQQAGLRRGATRGRSDPLCYAPFAPPLPFPSAFCGSTLPPIFSPTFVL